MKMWGAAVGGLVIVLVLPMLAIAVLVGAIFPAANAVTCDATNPTVSGTWRPPLLARYAVSSKFGPRYHPVLHTTKVHTGIDLVAASNKTVVAAADGTVKSRGFNTAYGNQVVVAHGGGIQTRYAHMASPGAVTEGQKVGAGTKLGTQGATGYVTGPHLHFEIIKNGKPIDPKPFMASQGAALNGGATPMSRARKISTEARQNLSTTRASTTGSLAATRTDDQKVTLNAEQLANAATIMRVGRHVGAGDRGVAIALMTSLQESALRNLNYGDRDSLGLFQQRAGWGTTTERRTPEWSARAFYGGTTGPNKGSPRGLLDTPDWKAMSLGQAAQAVQVSAYPTAYDKWEPVARTIMGGMDFGLASDCDNADAGSTNGQVRVATWNICLEFCGEGKLRPWTSRIPELATTIKRTRADIIALQETGKKKTHGTAIIKALARTYKVAAYHRSKMLLYDPTKLSTVTAQGTKLRSAKFMIEGKAGVAQVLRDRQTNKTIIVSSLHPNDGTNDARRLRYITRAFSIVDRLRMSQPGSTVIHAGDLNSYIPGKGGKKNVARFLSERGYRSAEQIAKKRNGNEYKSYNGRHQPARGSRIDHIIVDPRAVTVPRWRQVLTTTGASDHNLIWAELTLPEPTDDHPDSQVSP